MKVYSFKIPKKPGANIVVQKDEGKAFYDKLHQHEEIQISYMLKGNGKLIVGDSVHSFSSGNYFVIGSRIPHLFKSAIDQEKVEMHSVFFSLDSFGASFFDLQEMDELRPFFKFANTGFKLRDANATLAQTMERMFGQSNFYRFVSLMSILKEMSQMQKERLSVFVHSKDLSLDHGERLRTVFDFVMANFHQTITLDKIAKLVHMTPNAFCRFFKQRTNKTFFSFLNEIRVEHVCQILMEKKDMSIIEAANSSGFNSISNFNKTFKDIKGTSPTKYLNDIA